ncbi:hypothetical protein GIB67_040652 [Kingdonia uniflora]|uniref:Uncharacterized protein n=1 Tax=Kingdonia uniflora TaxID=39325 RepID=A0A7J7KU61_9MAGN|nr:hypothetical protein GIB67_040652 [Kingdonia uniflora]
MQASTQADKGKGKVFPESPKDDIEDIDEELTASEREEQAQAKAALMAKLCGTDPDEASRQMKSMYQTDAWAHAFNKAQKVAIRKLKQEDDNLELARETEASLALEIGISKRDQGTIRDECERRLEAQWLKEFHNDLGYDPETLQRLPMNLRYDPVADDVIWTEGAEVDVAGVGARLGDGAETPVIDIDAAVTVTEGVVGAAGSNPSTKGAGVDGEEETVGGDGEATPI